MKEKLDSFLQILKGVEELGMIRVSSKTVHTTLVAELKKQGFVKCSSVPELVAILDKAGSAYVDGFEAPLSYEVYSFIAQYMQGQIVLSSKNGTPESLFAPKAGGRLAILVAEDATVGTAEGVRTDMRALVGPALAI